MRVLHSEIILQHALTLYRVFFSFLFPHTHSPKQMASKFGGARRAAEEILRRHGQLDISGHSLGIEKLRERVDGGVDALRRQEAILRSLARVPQNLHADPRVLQEDLSTRASYLRVRFYALAPWMPCCVLFWRLRNSSVLVLAAFVRDVHLA